MNNAQDDDISEIVDETVSKVKRPTIKIEEVAEQSKKDETKPKKSASSQKSQKDGSSKKKLIELKDGNK